MQGSPLCGLCEVATGSSPCPSRPIFDLRDQGSVIVDSSPNTSVRADPAGAVLIVKLGDRQFGLPLASVERVLPMALVVSLPDSGDGMLGVLNLHGQVLPVIDPHPRLGLPSPRMSTEHRLVLLSGNVPFLLWVDDVEEVVASSPDALSVVPAQQASPLVPRVLRLGDSIVPVLAPAALEPRGR
jgi:purine-binding chemotaxis protein CheW